jgi:hypothetical protein
VVTAGPSAPAPCGFGITAKGYFGIEKTGQLIQRLKGEPNLRLLCGFTDVHGKAAFSRALAFLSEQGILEQTLEGMVRMAHKGLVVFM